MHRGLAWTSCLLGTWLFATEFAHAEPYAPRVGQRHAEFKLPDMADGRPVSLSDYRGKKLLLVHFASW